jgi:hypothetical protein
MKMTKIISYIHLLGCIGWSIFGLYLTIETIEHKDATSAFALFALFATTASGVYLFIVGRKKQPENTKTTNAILTKIISYIHLLGCIGWSILGLCIDVNITTAFALFALFATTASGIYLFIIRRQDLAQLWKIKKLIILWTGTFVIVALCLITLYNTHDYMDYLVRLIIQCAIAGLITGVLLYTLKD